MTHDSPRIAALLVDFDGTLADSLAYLRDVYSRFVREVGVEPTEAEFNSLNGPPIAEVVRLLCLWHDVSGPLDGWIERYHRLIDEEFAAVVPLAGAESLLAGARNLGLGSWIVTSNTRSRVERWLDSNGLARLCEVIVASEDGAEGKPSPAPYLMALRKLGLDASDAIAIEDSASGARSALAAGLVTLKIDSGSARPEPGLHPVRSLPDAGAALRRLVARG